MNLKAIGEYVGTSVAMIEKSYGRFISDRGLAPLLQAVATAWRSGERALRPLPQQPCGPIV